MLLDSVDLTLVGNSVGNVQGSMVWKAATNTLSFVKTGGVLAADTYNVTLFSGATAFHDAYGLLDGNHDFVAGDNYTNSFNVAVSSDRVLSVHDFARGSGQHIDDTAAVVNSRLAVSIDNAASVLSVDFEFHYDPCSCRLLALLCRGRLWLRGCRETGPLPSITRHLAY